MDDGDLLRRLNVERHLTVVLVTHNARAASHAQRAVELHDGRIAGEARGTITIIFSDIVGFSAMTERLGDVGVCGGVGAGEGPGANAWGPRQAGQRPRRRPIPSGRSLPPPRRATPLTRSGSAV